MLNFKENLDPFMVGRRVNSEEWNTITRTMQAADDTVRLGFGVPVKSGTLNYTCLEITSTTGEQFLGITEAMPTLPRPGDAGYARYDEVPVCEEGVIAVPTEGNVTEGAPARWNTATKKWTAAAQSATVVTIPGVIFEIDATAPGVAPIRLRKTVPSNTVSG